MKSLKKFLGIVSAIGIASTAAVTSTAFSYKEQDTTQINLNLGQVHLYDINSDTDAKTPLNSDSQSLRLNNRAMYRMFLDSDLVQPMISKFNANRQSYDKLSIDNFSIIMKDKDGNKLNYRDLIQKGNKTETIKVELKLLSSDSKAIEFEMVLNPAK